MNGRSASMRLFGIAPGVPGVPGFLAFLGFLGFLAALVAATSLAGEADVRRDVTYLASPELAGRLSGTAGSELAADYLVERLREIGARPLPGRDDFRIPFEFTAGMSDAGSTLTLRTGTGEPVTLTGVERVQALSFSDGAETSGPVVFAGYGLVVPEGQSFGYDSYHGLDLAGKVALVLRYFPEDTEGQVRETLSRYSGLRYKAMQARERGATALLVVTGPRSPNAGETVPMAFDTALAGSGIVAASIDGETARRLFAGAEGRDLEAVQKSLDGGNPHVAGFALPGVEVTLAARVNRERRTADNVVGVLPGGAGPVVLLGAHYDHLGVGGHGNSLARKDEAGLAHLGADDNASGVAAVLEVGRKLAGKERGRPVALAFWAGEELGLLGSTAFLKDGVLDSERLLAYVNFDMVGRLRDDRISLQSVGSSSVWPRLIEKSNVAVGLDLAIQDDPYLPTDSSAFYQAGVPSLNFFTGSHDDYHRPTDTADRINYAGIETIADLATRVVTGLVALDERPDYKTVARRAEAGGDRDTVRAFTGTIPDYTTEVEGLMLSGVIEGGPADKAGLRGGDVVVEFGGKTIANIYDYTYALEAVKIGQPVKVVFVREGSRHEVEMVPTTRDAAP